MVAGPGLNAPIVKPCAESTTRLTKYGTVQYKVCLFQHVRRSNHKFLGIDKVSTPEKLAIVLWNQELMKSCASQIPGPRLK
jgi:hypothetical protein